MLKFTVFDSASEEVVDKGKLAIALFCYRLARAVLGLTAALFSIDALIFTGGIGKNDASIRAQVLKHLAVLNPVIDSNTQHRPGSDAKQERITNLTRSTCHSHFQGRFHI